MRCSNYDKFPTVSRIPTTNSTLSSHGTLKDVAAKFFILYFIYYINFICFSYCQQIYKENSRLIQLQVLYAYLKPDSVLRTFPFCCVT